MKKQLILLLLLSTTLFLKVNGQDQVWWEMMKDPNVNFYTIQNEFNQYWNGREIEKGKGWKVFKRWEAFVEPRVYPSGNRNLLKTTLSEALQANLDSRNISGDWKYIGNTQVPNNGGGAGRINCIAFHPNDPNIIFAGSPAGGLWRSVNGGQSWFCNTDQLFNLGVSSIAFDPNNPSIVYLGTGDEDGSDFLGQGLLKSTDGGITWNTTGFSYAFQQDICVSKILINPTNTSEILIAASNGIHRSTDAGQNWTQIVTGSFRDMEFKPNDPNIVYAARSGSFYRSSNGGVSFTQITSGLANSSSMRRISVAVSPANANYVYLLVGSTSNGFFGLYRSTDAGLTFTLRSDSPNIMGWDSNGGDTGGQANYDMALAVDRTNAEIIFTGGVNIWRSTNGGTSWTIAGHWYGDNAPYVHADIHTLEYNVNNQLYSGNDGGVFRRNISTNVWTDISNNLQIGQLYRIGGSVSNPNLILSGWQDNGTALSGPIWNRVRGGDGMECIISHASNMVMYATIYYGRIYKSTDGGSNWNTVLNSGGSDEDEDGNWVTPYVQHPTNANTILVGKRQIYRTTNAGSSWSQVGNTGTGSSKHNAVIYAPSNPNYIYACKSSAFYVSTDGNTFTDRTSGLPNGASLQYIAVSNIDPEKVWVCYSGFNNSLKVYHSSNAGLNWSNYSTGIPNIPVNCILYQNNSNDALYIGTDLGVFYRDQSLNSWVPFNGGLPNTIVNELEIYYATGKIRAATYGRGLWESDLYSNVQNDIKAVSILYPTNETCGSSFAPEVKIKNNGDNLITTFQVAWQIDNGSISNFIWNGLLNSTEEVNIILPAITTSGGSHDFKFWTALPNTQADINNLNDTLQVSFIHDPTKIHAVLELNTDCFGTETSWEIKNSLNVTTHSAALGDYPGTLAYWAPGGQLNSEHVCLVPECYTFTISDQAGDGLNGTAKLCDMDGHYILLHENGDTLAQNVNANGNFGSTTNHTFCITNSFFSGFSVAPNTICEGNSVQFSDLSSPGSNTWNWSFPGGIPSTSNDQNPVVIYPNAGIYSVTLISGNGTDSDDITHTTAITVNSKPEITFSSTDVSCNTVCNGKIVAQLNGGGSLPVFNWSNGSGIDSIINLCAGMYTLSILDEKGCGDTLSYTITEPDAILVDITITDANCGVADGSIHAAISGGVSPYTLLWPDGSSNNQIDNLDIGTYLLSVEDANNCIINTWSIIANPNAPQLSSTVIKESCAGDCDGSLSTQASGGTGIYTYTWDNGLGNDSVYNGLCSGTYIVRVADENLCADRDTIVVLPGFTYPNVNFILSTDTIGAGQSMNFINMGSGSATHYLWNFGDGGTASFSSTTHIYADTGVFTVSFIVSNHGCSDTGYAQIVVVDVSSVDENEMSQTFQIYPNPGTDFVIVNFNTLVQNTTLEFFDNKGRLVNVYNITSGTVLEINLSTLSNGIYYLSAFINDVRITKKLIVKKN